MPPAVSSFDGFLQVIKAGEPISFSWSPSDANAHPHTDEKGRVALVHNGIFENYAELRASLTKQGVRLSSDTDTEVLAHMIGIELGRGTALAEAVRKSLNQVTGYYAIAALALEDGEPKLVCARQGPPLMVAVTPDSAWLASDVLALIPHTRDVIVLEDGDVAELSIGSARIVRLDGTPVERAPRRIDWDPETAAKGTFPHFMLKEIHEQPDVLARTAFDRVREEKGDVAFEGNGFSDESLKKVSRVSVHSNNKRPPKVSQAAFHRMYRAINRGNTSGPR